MKSLATYILLGVFGSSHVQAEVSRGLLGNMQVPLGYGIVLNEGSTLQREWVVVNDDRMPAVIKNEAAPVPTFSDRDYTYLASYGVTFNQPVSAVEFRFILFDVWGDRTKTLSATEVSDFEPGNHIFNHRWNLRENEASEFYASIGYVAQIRLANGEIIRADTELVLEEARRFAATITLGDLAPD